jgi:glutaredoxin
MQKPILYIKAGCPWCREALHFFDEHGVDLNVKDVTKDSGAMDRMVNISGQTQTPTFEYEDFVVADFDVDEFKAELDENPEMRRRLGLGDDEE